MSLFTALLAAHVISSAPSCNQVVIKTIEGAVCASLDFDNEINSKITFETGCKYIVTDCNITASAAGEMEHKAGSKFVMRGSTTFTLNGIARVAGGIGIEGGKYLNNNLLLVSEAGVFRVHQNGEATNGKTGSFYIAGDFINENLFTNLGADSDGDNDGVPFGVTNDGAITNHKNITNLGTMKNKGTILNKQGGVINNERQEIEAAGVAIRGDSAANAASSCQDAKDSGATVNGHYYITSNGQFTAFKAYCWVDGANSNAYTLIRSFKRDGLQLRGFNYNEPLNNNVEEDKDPDEEVDFDGFRMSRYKMISIVPEHASSSDAHIGATCSLNGADGDLGSFSDPHDHALIRFSDWTNLGQSPLDFTGDAECRPMASICIRAPKDGFPSLQGGCCDGCNIRWWGGGFHLHVDTGGAHYCPANNWHSMFSSGVGSEDNFGYNGNKNPDFTCTNNENSRTMWWIEG